MLTPPSGITFFDIFLVIGAVAVSVEPCELVLLLMLIIEIQLKIHHSNHCIPFEIKHSNHAFLRRYPLKTKGNTRKYTLISREDSLSTFLLRYLLKASGNRPVDSWRTSCLYSFSDTFQKSKERKGNRP